MLVSTSLPPLVAVIFARWIRCVMSAYYVCVKTEREKLMATKGCLLVVKSKKKKRKERKSGARSLNYV